MFTRFVIVTLIVCAFISTADARRRHAHRSHSDRHRVFEPARTLPVLDPPSVFETGTGRTGWLELNPLELRQLEMWVDKPAPKPEVVWLKETSTVVIPKGPSAIDFLGAASLGTGIAVILHLLLRAVTGRWGAETQIVLLRVQPGSWKITNVLRLRWKQAKTFALSFVSWDNTDMIKEEMPCMRRGGNCCCTSSQECWYRELPTGGSTS